MVSKILKVLLISITFAFFVTACDISPQGYYDAYWDEPDKAKALKLILKSAELEYAQAQYVLGSMYQGEGGREGLVEPNTEEAIRWYQKAAEQGDDRARKALLDVEEWSLALEKELEKKKREVAVKLAVEKRELADKKRELAFKEILEEPYRDNRKTIVALAAVKSDSEWSRRTSDDKVSASVRTIIVDSKCYPYVQIGVITIFPVAKTIINANGTNLHVVGIGMGHKLTSIGFVGKNVAGRQYLMTEFKSKNAVNFVIDNKSYTISANGFTKGLQATIATCNDRAKKLSKTL